MQTRKTDKANLENKKGLFTGVGLLLITAVIFAAFSFKSYNKMAFDFKLEVEEEIVDLPPVTTPPPPPPPPPPAAKPPVEPELEIVEEELEEEEMKFEDEDDEDLEIDDEPIADEEEEEVLEETPVVFSKDMPYYDECKDAPNNNARHGCTMNLIQNQMRKNFVVPPIVQEMGVGGKCVVRFIVGKDGRISGYEILQSSGNEHIDAAAIEAAKKLKPLNPGTRQDKAASFYYSVPVKIAF